LSATAPAVRADAIVVAAGSSNRMAGTDKLLASIGGRPLVAWAVAAIAATPAVERIVLVTSADRVATWRSAAWLDDKVRDVVAGGARRQDSVAAGVHAIEALGADPERVILVHDGARPAVAPALVEAVARAAAEHGAAVPIVAIAETVKRIADGRVGETVDRAGLAVAQTPQGVRLGLLRTALARLEREPEQTFTDEAALLEACTIPVHAIHGDPRNLKVTLPADLDRAASILVAERTRVGFGFDGHPFGPGEPLRLGGLEFPGAPRLHGHSDGDVALHAVADALLGAAGLGDLGRLFPADAATPRGIASSELLVEVIRKLESAGWRPVSVDLTIVAARPRLAPRLDDMAARIAQLVSVDAGQVAVKASTGNLDGMDGAGRGISARAVAVVRAAG
jgi:2-C-methyl-D-erythritol 4-phosphate cytidylyltransferase/2-C-methyl-D-erythritol 2,4-cyclodiphosphate synthase